MEFKRVNILKQNKQNIKCRFKYGSDFKSYILDIWRVWYTQQVTNRPFHSVLIYPGLHLPPRMCF